MMASIESSLAVHLLPQQEAKEKTCGIWYAMVELEVWTEPRL